MLWRELDILVSELEKNYPDVDLEDLSTSDIYDLILDLPEFSDDPENVDENLLKNIIESWTEYRTDL